MMSKVVDSRTRLMAEYNRQWQEEPSSGVKHESRVINSEDSDTTLIGRLIQYHLHHSCFAYSNAEAALRDVIHTFQQRDRDCVEQEVLGMAQVNLIALSGSKRLTDLHVFPLRENGMIFPPLHLDCLREIDIEVQDEFAGDVLYNTVLETLVKLTSIPWTHSCPEDQQSVTRMLGMLEKNYVEMNEVELMNACYLSGELQILNVRLLRLFSNLIFETCSPAIVLQKLATMEYTLSLRVISRKLQSPAESHQEVRIWLQALQVLRSNQLALLGAFPHILRQVNQQLVSCQQPALNSSSLQQHSLDPAISTLWKLFPNLSEDVSRLSLPQVLAVEYNARLSNLGPPHRLLDAKRSIPSWLDTYHRMVHNKWVQVLSARLGGHCKLANRWTCKVMRLMSCSAAHLTDAAVARLALMLASLDENWSRREVHRFLSHFPLPKFIATQSILPRPDPLCRIYHAQTIDQLKMCIVFNQSQAITAFSVKWSKSLTHSFQKAQTNLNLSGGWKQFAVHLAVRSGDPVLARSLGVQHSLFLDTLNVLDSDETWKLAQFNHNATLKVNSEVFMIDPEEIERECDWRSLLESRVQRVRSAPPESFGTLNQQMCEVTQQPQRDQGCRKKVTGLGSQGIR